MQVATPRGSSNARSASFLPNLDVLHLDATQIFRFHARREFSQPERRLPSRISDFLRGRCHPM